MADYELLELLLFFSIHRRDTKPVAKAMLEAFGSLGAVLAAEPTRYQECLGAAPADASTELRQNVNLASDAPSKGVAILKTTQPAGSWEFSFCLTAGCVSASKSSVSSG